MLSDSNVLNDHNIPNVVNDIHVKDPNCLKVVNFTNAADDQNVLNEPIATHGLNAVYDLNDANVRNDRYTLNCKMF